ncbi:MAG: isoprenylcysteine carboxylmethyltransferase family protein [Pseudaminobacter sp.]|nr:isoprenylcysteine carboxylmethyltransferase family protein [Pseudaminobacter sp.]
MSDIRPTTNRLPWPPIVYLAAIAISIILGFLYPLPWISAPLSDILFAAGWLIVAAALAILFSAIRTMKRAKTTLNPNGIPDHFVTTGPFSFSRNPMYLANTLMMIGIGFVSQIAWFIPMAILAAFVTGKIAIEREEKLLEERFGKKYRDYAKRVRRWI